jgi:hypothetical protein
MYPCQENNSFEWSRKETSMPVKRWLDKYIRVSSSEIDNARISEERE